MDKVKDSERFTQIMNGLVYNFGGTPDKSGLVMQFEALKEYRIEQIGDAAVWILKNRTERFMPTIAEIVEVIEGKHKQSSFKDCAVIESNKAIQALKEYGRFQKSIEFHDPVTNYLMTENWDYKTLADTILEKDFVWFKKEFIDAYTSYREKLKVGEIDFKDLKWPKKFQKKAAIQLPEHFQKKIDNLKNGVADLI